MSESLIESQRYYHVVSTIHGYLGAVKGWRINGMDKGLGHLFFPVAQ